MEEWKNRKQNTTSNYRENTEGENTKEERIGVLWRLLFVFGDSDIIPAFHYSSIPF